MFSVKTVLAARSSRRNRSDHDLFQFDLQVLERLFTRFPHHIVPREVLSVTTSLQASLGVELSTHFVRLMSWILTFPAPAPPPTWAEPLLVMPQDQARTSISFGWALSFDSPLTVFNLDEHVDCHNIVIILCVFRAGTCFS